MKRKFILFDFSKETNETLLSKLDELSAEQGFLFQQVWDFHSNKRASLEVKSSGSTGIPKVFDFPKTAWDTSVVAFAKAFKIHKPISCIHALPLEFVAGKMLLYRAMSLGWKLYFTSPGRNILQDFNGSVDMIPLTPFQLLSEIDQLHKVKWVLLGGAQVSHDLAIQLQSCETPVYQTFAMTETLTNFAYRKVNQVQGDWPPYQAYQGIQIRSNAEQCLEVNYLGITSGFLQTHDLIELVSEREFYWLGRKDFVVNSGGLKIAVEELESLLAPHIPCNFFLAGIPHTELGEELVLVLEAADNESIDVELSELKKLLPKGKSPRKILYAEKFSYTANFKIRRKESLALAF